jgi:hypothetical protein
MCCKKLSGNQEVVKEETYTVPTLPHTDQEYWYLKRKKNGLFEAWTLKWTLKAKIPVPKTKQTTNKEGLHSGDDKLVKLWSMDCNEFLPSYSNGLGCKKSGYRSKSAVASYLHKTCMNNF